MFGVLINMSFLPDGKGCQGCLSAYCLFLRMLTDPNLPGVEKISTASIPKEFLDGDYSELPSTIGGRANFQAMPFNVML